MVRATNRLPKKLSLIAHSSPLERRDIQIQTGYYTGRRARVVKEIYSKPIVISRAGSSPAVDAIC